MSSVDNCIVALRVGVNVVQSCF